MANEREPDIVKERGINANSILLIILMGISSWALVNQIATGKDTTAIKTAQIFFKETLDKVEAKMVTKPELDNKVIEMELKRVEFENRILRTINDEKESKRVLSSGH